MVRRSVAVHCSTLPHTAHTQISNSACVATSLRLLLPRPTAVTSTVRRSAHGASLPTDCSLLPRSPRCPVCHRCLNLAAAAAGEPWRGVDAPTSALCQGNHCSLAFATAHRGERTACVCWGATVRFRLTATLLRPIHLTLFK